ncbi:glycosyltransferase family 4 protein [Neorhizobium sp. DAR64861/K0K2]|uniref:glycosyltransferase family 4 protein n=1 Tax=unclassified Neorhizobium TaxID=2629175 RepID=UPI003D27D44D
MLIVLLATEWSTREGGINSFNYSFAVALAKLCQSGDRVVCAVTAIRDGDEESARRANIELIKVSADSSGRPVKDSSREIEGYLDRNGWKSPDGVVVGHDCITGWTAVETARRLRCRVALIHHMAYEKYQNAGGGQGEKTGASYQEQADLFATPGALIFGVGTYLTSKAKALCGGDARCLIPGFPDEFSSNASIDEDFCVVAAGRFTTETESLKQVELAVEAFGQAIKSAGPYVPRLQNSTMLVLGVDPQRIKNGKLERLAERNALRRVNVVPMPFESDPRRIRRHLQSANLAIVPSFHEGFGLVGWEAIGCEVPLIMGRDTGLCRFVESAVGTTGIKVIDFMGGPQRKTDVAAVAKAIGEVALNPELAKLDAKGLRDRLKNEHGCTWGHTANEFLKVIGGRSSSSLASSRALRSGPRQGYGSDNFKSKKQDHYPKCVELSLSVGQGSNAEKFDVLAELRFGTFLMASDGIDAEISLSRAHVNVSSTTGKISAHRLGDNPTLPGLRPQAGGVWIITDPGGGDSMTHRALGDEPLCQIENLPNNSANVEVEVLASKKDITCVFDLAPEERGLAKEKIMSAFLKNALFEGMSGQVIFSTATMSEEPEND